MDIRQLGWVIAAGMAAGSGQALAAPDYASIPLTDGVRATPALDLETRHDGNIFQTDDNEEDSIVTVVSPAVSLEAGGGLDSLTASYSGSYGYYESSSDDNYADHSFSIDGSKGGGLGTLSGYVGLDLGHDDRGTGPSNGLGGLTTAVFDEPTEFETYSWGGMVALTGGGRTSIDLGYDGLDTEYTNFRSFTRARDRRSDEFSVDVGYELTGKTSAVLEASTKDVRYDFTPAGADELDSDEIRVSGGLEWDATARTTGRVTLGWKEKDFDAASRDDQSGLTWGAQVTWAPKTYSTFTFGTQNGFRETDNEGDVIETTSYNVGWNYAMNERFSWNTGVSLTTEEYEGAASGRDDDFYSFNVSADYDWRRWLTVSGGLDLSMRSSSEDRADFDRNKVFVRVMMGL
jgi:hypothetical protein